MSARFTLLAGLLSLLLLPLRAEASNGAMPAFYGAKGPVSLPYGGDGQTAFRMPSGVAWNLQHRVDLDAFFLYSTTSLKNSLNDFTSSSFGPAASFGVVFAPGERESEDAEGEPVHPEHGTLSLHFGFYPEIGGGGGRARVFYTTFPNGIGTKTGLLFLSTALSVAYAPTDWVSLGVGFQLTYATLSLRSLVGGTDSSLNGSPLIAGVPLPGNPTYADFLNILSSDSASDPTTLFESDLSAIQFGTIFSVSFRPHDMLALGFSYRPRSWAPFPFKGDGTLYATATFNNALAGLDPAVSALFLATLPDGGANGFVAGYQAEITGLRIPRQVRANFAVYPTDWLLIAGEVAWIEWHRAFNRANVRLTKGTNTDLNFVIGSTSVGTTSVLRWRNQWVFSGYVAALVTDDLTLRAGFNYGDSPVNAQYAGNSGNAAFVAATMTFGAGYWVTENVELSFLTEIAFPDPDRSGPNTDTLTSNNSSYSAFQATFHFGLSVLF